jgi:hypothetical protein
MAKKLNLFTLLIFVYSLVVCVILKKEENKTSLSALIEKTPTIQKLSKVQPTIAFKNLLAFKK